MAGILIWPAYLRSIPLADLIVINKMDLYKLKMQIIRTAVELAHFYSLQLKLLG